MRILKQKMKHTFNLVPTRFRPARRFEIVPAMGSFADLRDTAFEQLKGRLLRQLLGETADPVLQAPLRRAANEAAGLAWLTPYPLLFFPVLLEEKARAARRQQVRQREIQQQTRDLLRKASLGEQSQD